MRYLSVLAGKRMGMVALLPVLFSPKEALHRLKLKRGDSLSAVETPEEQVKLGLEFMAKYRNAFRALDK